MKIHLVSDLHTDSWEDFASVDPVDEIQEDLGDVLIVAGDLMECERRKPEQIVDTFKRLRAKAERVLYLPGNHEYYRLDFNALDLKSMCKAVGIDWIGREVVTIEGQRFLGATLWYNTLAPDVEAQGRDWSDFCIGGHSVFNPGEHRRDVEFLRGNVRKGDVVITHFLPSHASVAPQYAGAATNVYFVVPQDTLIKMAAPKLWLHGHTHTPCDYHIGQTRVACAPLGHPSEVAVAEMMDERLCKVIEI